MQSRMDKYYEEEVEENVSSRVKKNKELYKEVSNLELEDFDLNSNVSVIGNNTDNININDIKNILNKKYHEHPRKKSFGDTDELPLPEIHLDETREYDINSILEKAKEGKEVDYEEERLKKIRNTQYDILKSLDIINGEEEIEEKNEDEKPTDRRPSASNPENEKKLHDLIDTITAKEMIENESKLEVTGEMDPLDILSDLRGDDEATKVMGMLNDELKAAENENKKVSKENTMGIEPEEIEEKETEETDDTEKDFDTEENMLDEKPKKKKNKKDEKIKGLDNSFIGNTTTFTQSDFDDFNDLKEDMHITKIIIRILIFVIIVIFIIALVILANKYLGLGLF